LGSERTAAVEPRECPVTMTVLRTLRDRTPEMLDALRALVAAESPTSEPGACAACADVVDDLALKLLGARAERIDLDGRVHLRWSFGRPRVLLIGHFDTVWPLGTLARWPFERRADTVTGPGVFDMKAGIVQLLYALAALDDLDGVGVLLTSDEEIGSPSSRALVEATATGVEAALVLEPSAHGALKTRRKGVFVYRIGVAGRAAHAGLDPERGVNAAVELAHQLVAIAALARPEQGTTVTPSLVQAGTSANTVPAAATADVDVRTRTREEAERVAAAMAALRPVLPEASLAVEQAASVPPLEHSASAALFARAKGLNAELGLPELTEAEVGGGSDGSVVAALGIPTLDGLGAVGDNAHAEGEFVFVDAMAERAALVAALVDDIRG
jgi:glutamate carboxypeptidase